MQTTPLTRKDIQVVGVRSPVIEAGPQTAEEAVVFVHGNPGSSQDWEELIPSVGTFARAVAFDMPGFGQADKPADFDYTAQGYAHHLGAMLTELGIHRAHLVLHDWGGPWGLIWASQHQDAFASLTLINAAVLLDYRWHWLARIWRTPVLGEVFQATANRPFFGLLLKQGNPRELPKAAVDRMFAQYDRGTRRAVLKLYRATDDPAGLAQQQAEALRPLGRPALVVWGKHDSYIPVKLAYRQREVFPDAQIVILEQSGHFPFLDDPSSVAAAVLPFLRQQVSYSDAT